MRHARASWRLLRLLAHAARGLWTIKTRFPGWSALPSASRPCSAGRPASCTLAGIELQVGGAPLAAGPVLLVANHISWLDIVVLHAAGYCRFVAQGRHLRQWPLIGALATGAGTLYIERASRRDAMRVVHHMRDRLAGR